MEPQPVPESDFDLPAKNNGYVENFLQCHISQVYAGVCGRGYIRYIPSYHPVLESLVYFNIK
jgi:hypothetical protein